MSTVATQSLLGQSPEVVQGVLGFPRFHQPNPDNQTDLYVYSPNYLRDLFPVQTTGVIGVYRSNQCIALKMVFSKTDPRYDSFIYNREVASRLFDRVIGGGYAYWQEIEAEPRDNGIVHYVYCMGHRTATTWDAAALDQTIASDVSIFLDNRCQANDDSDLSQPITQPNAPTSRQHPLLRPATPGSLRPDPGEVEPNEPLVFPDIADNLYQTEILKAANTYHIITGYADGSFKPTTAITREQGLVMLLKAMERLMRDSGAMVIPDQLTEPPFADVPIDHPSAPQFFYAKQVGIMAGDDNNNALPNAPMTRAELIALLNGGLQVVVEVNYTPTTTLAQALEPAAPTTLFTDISGHWAEVVMREMQTYGIASPLKETGDKFAPNSPAERDYTTAALVRMIELQFRDHLGGETRPALVQVFPDIGNDIYKEEIIRAANQYQLVAGYEDKKFHPLDDLSREQAVTILINTMQTMVENANAIQIPETLSDPPPFPDVKAGGNATKIQFAKEAGLISGDDQGNFRPLGKVSRAELMAMITKGLNFVVKANLGQARPLGEVVQGVEPPPPPFSDIPADHWVTDMLPDMGRIGIATPFNEEGTAFKPDQPCLRNYAAAAMVRMAEANFGAGGTTRPNPPITFTDIQGNPFEDEILLAANQYSLVAGYEDGRFKPTVPATREQAVAMLVDALKQKVTNPDAVSIPDHLIQPPFKDVDMNRWSATRIYFAKQAGIVAGDDLGRFNPEAQISRAQLVAMADKTLRYAIQADLKQTSVDLEQVIQPLEQTYTFIDIPDTHWGKTMITEMGTVGLAIPLKAESPDKFSPDAPALRDYSVATCVRLIQASYRGTSKPIDDQVQFNDIADSPFAAEIVKAANQYELVSGNQDGTFRPAESIRREHLVAMLVEALQYMVNDPEAINIPTQVNQAPFVDVPANSLYAARIKFIADAGIMSGDRDTRLFRPQNDLTRAELMAVIQNALTFVVKHRYGNTVTLDMVIPAEAGVAFSDLNGHWAQADIEQMGKFGIALPQPAGSTTFIPNLPSRRDFATASLVHMLEVPFEE